MCTVVILHRPHAQLPLVLGANRDEFLDRPTQGPQVLSHDPRVVGGRDLERAGTWLGVTPRGFVVVVTNYRAATQRDLARRSRGQLVLDVLRAGSTDAALDLLTQLPARDFNPFNLLFGDARSLHVAYGRDDHDSLLLEPVPPGVHVLPTDRLNLDLDKVTRTRTRATQIPDADWPHVRADLIDTLRDHAAGPGQHPIPHAVQSVCVHAPGYGTRSSSLLALRPDHVLAYEYADGPPCQTTFTSAHELVA